MGPIFGRAVIVDKSKKHHGVHSFKECIQGSQDYVFSSHTLEHTEDPLAILRKMHLVLKNHGKILLIVPCWTMHRWRKRHTRSHKHTFCLKGDEEAGEEGEIFTAIDSLVKQAHFTILEAKYTWENAIFIFAEKIL